MLNNETERRLKQHGWLIHAAGLGVTVTSVAAVFVFVFASADTRSRELARESATLQDVINRREDIIKTNRRLNRELKQVRQQIETLDAQVPQSPRESDFLAQLSELARKSHLEIRDYQPGVARTAKQASELEISLSIEGTYLSLCEFFDGLQSIPRLCRFHNLTIRTPAKEDSNTLSADMSLKLYFVSDSDPSEREI